MAQYNVKNGGGKTMLPPDFKPSNMDVLCARGKVCYHWPGNKRFRKLVEMSVQQYTDAPSKLHKSFIVMGIIETIREGSPGSGGFVREMPDGAWVEIGDHSAREKVGQTFRQILMRNNIPARDDEKRQELAREFHRAKSDSEAIERAAALTEQPVGRSASLSDSEYRTNSFSELSLVPPPLQPMTTTDRLIAQIPPMLTQYTSRDWFASEEDTEFKRSVASEDVTDLHRTLDAWTAGANVNKR